MGVRVMTLTWNLLTASLLLLAAVSPRSLELRENRAMEPVLLEFPSPQAYSPRRFIKISKRPQSEYPLWVGYPYLDLVLDTRPAPSPFHSEEGAQEREEEEHQFRRSLRNNEEDSRAAEDYYNEWIMSNVG